MQHFSSALLLLSLTCVSMSSAIPDSFQIRACGAISSLTAIPDLLEVDTANRIKKCLLLDLDWDVRAKLLKLKNLLPTSIHNAVFLDEVCVVNKYFKGFLYAPTEGYLLQDSNSRHVFNSIKGTRATPRRGDWRFQPTGEYYFHIVASNTGEYLTTSDNVENERRVVYTRWEQNATMEATWMLEVVDDNVKIVNLAHAEYLAITGGNFDKDTRRVMTCPVDPLHNCINKPSVWMIVAC